VLQLSRTAMEVQPGHAASRHDGSLWANVWSSTATVIYVTIVPQIDGQRQRRPPDADRPLDLAGVVHV
jgi:hypothetical protein